METNSNVVGLWDKTGTVVKLHRADCGMLRVADIRRATVRVEPADLQDMRERGYSFVECKCTVTEKTRRDPTVAQIAARTLSVHLEMLDRAASGLPLYTERSYRTAAELRGLKVAAKTLYRWGVMGQNGITAKGLELLALKGQAHARG